MNVMGIGTVSMYKEMRLLRKERNILYGFIVLTGIIGEFGGVFDPGGVVTCECAVLYECSEGGRLSLVFPKFISWLVSLWFSLLFPLSIQGIWLVDSFKAEFNAERSMGCCILLEAVAR